MEAPTSGSLTKPVLKFQVTDAWPPVFAFDTQIFAAAGVPHVTPAKEAAFEMYRPVARLAAL